MSPQPVKRATLGLLPGVSGFEGVDSLAERLGVRQAEAGAHRQVLIEGTSGRRFDVFELVNAVLDRFEAGS